MPYTFDYDDDPVDEEEDDELAEGYGSEDDPESVEDA